MTSFPRIVILMMNGLGPHAFCVNQLVYMDILYCEMLMVSTNLCSENLTMKINHNLFIYFILLNVLRPLFCALTLGIKAQ